VILCYYNPIYRTRSLGRQIDECSPLTRNNNNHTSTEKCLIKNNNNNSSYSMTFYLSSRCFYRQRIRALCIPLRVSALYVRNLYRRGLTVDYIRIRQLNIIVALFIQSLDGWMGELLITVCSTKVLREVYHYAMLI